MDSTKATNILADLFSQWRISHFLHIFMGCQKLLGAVAIGHSQITIAFADDYAIKILGLMGQRVEGLCAATARFAEMVFPAGVVVLSDTDSVGVGERGATAEVDRPDGEVSRVDNFEPVSLLLASAFECEREEVGLMTLQRGKSAIGISFRENA